MTEDYKRGPRTLGSVSVGLRSSRENIKSKYYCQKCEGNHFFDSTIGQEHLKHRWKDPELIEKPKEGRIKKSGSLFKTVEELRTKEVKKLDFIHTTDTLIELFDCIKTQVQIHVDFVNEHLDMVHDVTGLPSELTPSQLTQVLALEEEIERASKTVVQTVKQPTWMNYPMTPVASSFIKGAGAYKGKLLLEFHHSPGNIWGFDVEGQGGEFFRELLNSGSKGGWVWDKILGKPSIYGMAKGKFFAYQDKNGEQRFYTTKPQIFPGL